MKIDLSGEILDMRFMSLPPLKFEVNKKIETIR